MSEHFKSTQEIWEYLIAGGKIAMDLWRDECYLCLSPKGEIVDEQNLPNPTLDCPSLYKPWVKPEPKKVKLETHPFKNHESLYLHLLSGGSVENPDWNCHEFVRLVNGNLVNQDGEVVPDVFCCGRIGEFRRRKDISREMKLPTNRAILQTLLEGKIIYKKGGVHGKVFYKMNPSGTVYRKPLGAEDFDWEESSGFPNTQYGTYYYMENNE